ncbi:MAG: patatin-like phospholipase family protein [Anaerolineales bacterium]|nr:patatin-like phospholipase family protein [Anaerolineales bacterium]
MKLFNKAKNKKIGLALGGGAVLGAAHIGVLKAIDELNIPVHFISGTSIGAFISAFYAFGKSWEEIEASTKDLNWLDLTGLSISKLGLLSNQKLGDVITKNIGNVNLEDAEIPISMVATDITNGEKVIISKGDVEIAVMASTCIPGIFIPVEIDNRLLVDGGIVENVPVTPLKNMGADFIISVDLRAEHHNKKPENIVEVLLRTYDFTLKAATKLQTEKADIQIKLDLSRFNMVDINQADELIHTGYVEAKKALANIS